MLTLSGSSSLLPRLNNRRSTLSFALTKRSLVMRALTRDTIDISLDVAADSRKHSFPILVNGCTGKMGQAVAEAAVSAGLELVPVSFSSVDKPARTLEIGDIEIRVHGPSERDEVLSSVTEKYPDVVVVDYTVPNAVNANAELYCKFKVPFVMGTTGGDRQLLYKTVQDSNVYSVISPQMGKQVVAFLAAMEIMSEQFPGAFAGYKLEVMESHQATKLDTSGTAKAVIACFQKLGAIFDMNEVMTPQCTRQLSLLSWALSSLNSCFNPLQSCF
ncbi:putative 4-hydroxy-tetrahydrodipicolinate reductase 1, chloroplastic isoform X2 [Carex rostrata]